MVVHSVLQVNRCCQHPFFLAMELVVHSLSEVCAEMLNVPEAV
jgi:hypothetical protein